MACSLSSSSFCRAITAMMIFLSSSVRWLRSGISGMDGGAVGGRGPPWGPTEADIFSTTTTTPPPSPPPPPPPPRRVVSADRFSRSGFRATPHDMVHGRSGSGGRSSGEKREPLIFRRHPRLCFLCVCLSSPVPPHPPPARLSPPPPGFTGSASSGVFSSSSPFFLHGGSRVELRGPLDNSLVCGASAVVRLELDVRAV